MTMCVCMCVCACIFSIGNAWRHWLLICNSIDFEILVRILEFGATCSMCVCVCIVPPADIR